jgi:hypothetical protein
LSSPQFHLISGYQWSAQPSADCSVFFYRAKSSKYLAFLHYLSLGLHYLKKAGNTWSAEAIPLEAA